MAAAALSVCACSPRVIDAVVEVGAGDAGPTDGSTGGGGKPPSDVQAGDGFEAGPKPLLLHRYSFAGGAGQVVVPDLVAGGASATIYNAALSGAGYVQLPGGGAAGSAPPAYVDLPNFLVSRLTDVTIEAWVNWDGVGNAWQRVFDFGEDFSGADLDAAPRPDPADQSRDGRSYLYLTPADIDGVLRVAYFKPEDAVPRPRGVTTRETAIHSTQALPVGLRSIDVTIQGTTMSLYLGGVFVGNATLPGQLADIYDVNCWLGRSQFPADPTFGGRFYDFRIYGVALTPQQIAANAQLGAATPAIQ